MAKSKKQDGVPADETPQINIPDQAAVYDRLEDDPDMDFPEDETPPATAPGDQDGAEGDDGSPAQSDEDEGEEDPDSAINDLRKQIADESAARAKAEQERDEARERIKSEGAKSMEDKIILVESNIEQAITKKNSEIEKLTADLEAALDDGDHKTAAELNRKLARADNELIGIENYKANFERQKEQYIAAKDKPPAKGAEDTERYTPKAKEWIDRNPDFKTNDDGTPANEFTAVAIGAHERAMIRKLKEDSDEYFTFIEEQLRKEGFLKTNDDGEPAAPASRAPKTSTAAPSGERGGGSPPAGKGGRVKGRLTAEEMEAAEMSGMEPEEYWEAKYGKSA